MHQEWCSSAWYCISSRVLNPFFLQVRQVSVMLGVVDR
jgi:hypothetical protein